MKFGRTFRSIRTTFPGERADSVSSDHPTWEKADGSTRSRQRHLTEAESGA